MITYRNMLIPWHIACNRTLRISFNEAIQLREDIEMLSLRIVRTNMMKNFQKNKK